MLYCALNHLLLQPQLCHVLHHSMLLLLVVGYALFSCHNLIHFQFLFQAEFNETSVRVHAQLHFGNRT